MFKCEFCEREFKTKIGLKTHMYRCKNNPLHDEHNKKYSDAIKKGVKKAEKPTKYFEYTSYCQKCGKEFTQFTTQSLINSNKHKRCCSSVCAHSRNHSEIVKTKIRESITSFFESVGRSRRSSKPRKRKNCAISNLKSIFNRTKEILEHKCIYCNKVIYGKFKHTMYCYECAEEHNLPNLLLYTKDGKIMPSKKRRESSRRAQLKLVAEGRHKGWQSRNIVSYPEKFWQEVLKNNNISYSFNHPVKKSDLGVKDDDSNYFLDFLIGENFDLEIDGKQHSYKERKESDALRDELLNKNGYIVYRVKWNEIVSDRGKLLMEQKIDNFLKFYKQHFKLISEL